MAGAAGTVGTGPVDYCYPYESCSRTWVAMSTHCSHQHQLDYNKSSGSFARHS